MIKNNIMRTLEHRKATWTLLAIADHPGLDREGIMKLAEDEDMASTVDARIDEFIGAGMVDVFSGRLSVSIEGQQLLPALRELDDMEEMFDALRTYYPDIENDTPVVTHFFKSTGRLYQPKPRYSMPYLEASE